MRDLLPIGSVVLLKGAVKKIMIIGYMAIDKENTSKTYDYSGCIYPEGLLSSDQTLLFDHEQINQVFFEGYQNEESELFKNQLKEVHKQLTESKKTLDTLE